MDIEQLISYINNAAEQRGGCTVGIDGRSAAGKSTLAAFLSERLGAGLIHADDFFLPPELRTPERYDEPGGNFHYERFEREVLSELRVGSDGFRYHVFDCSDFSADKLSAPVSGKIKIVEGAYCTHPRFGGIYDIRIFCDISPEEQKRRILIRNGAEKLAVFLEKWIPLEEKYISACGIKDRADIVICDS